MTKAEFEALRERAYALNKINAARAEKCADMDILVSGILKLPYGQLKKLLTDDVMAVLEKYGYSQEVGV